MRERLYVRAYEYTCAQLYFHPHPRSTYQIIFSINLNLDLKWPDPFSSIAKSVSLITNMDMADGLGLACLDPTLGNFHQRVLFSSAVPLVVFALIWLAYLFRRGYSNVDKNVIFSQV